MNTKSLFNKLFSADYVNIGRQKELDVFKGMAVVFMTLIHVSGLFATTEQLSSPLGDFIYNIIGGPFGAPSFMVCMGVGIWYAAYNKTGKDDIEHGIIPDGQFKRGLFIFICGVIINLVTTVIMPYIGYLIEEDEKLLLQMDKFWGCDIYHFAGLALMLLGALRVLKVKVKWLIPIALFMSIAGTLLRHVSTGVPVLDIIGNFLWGIDYNSYFPLLNWFIFPVVGFVGSYYFARCKDKSLFYLVSSIGGTVMISAYIAFCLLTSTGFTAFSFYGYTPDAGYDLITDYGFYWCSTIDSIFFLGAVMCVFGISYAITQIFRDYSFPVLTKWGKNLMAMYSLQWVYIAIAYGIVFMTTEEELPIWCVLLATAVVLLLTDITVTLYKKILKPAIKNAISKRRRNEEV